MIDENNNSNTPPELILDTVVEVAPDDLSDEQTAFLQENAEDLSDEQKETFKDVIKKEDGDIDPEDIKIETRTKLPEKNKDEEGEDEIDPDDEARINKTIDRRLKNAGLGAAKDQLEVDALIRSKPEMGKYRAVMLKYMANPAYSNIPAHNIASMVSAEDQQKIGAQRERDASQRAKNTQGGGNSARKPTGVKTDWSKATAEEVEAKKNEIYGRRI